MPEINHPLLKKEIHLIYINISLNSITQETKSEIKLVLRFHFQDKTALRVMKEHLCLDYGLIYNLLNDVTLFFL